VTGEKFVELVYKISLQIMRINNGKVRRFNIKKLLFVIAICLMVFLSCSDKKESIEKDQIEEISEKPLSVSTQLEKYMGCWEIISATTTPGGNLKVARNRVETKISNRNEISFDLILHPSRPMPGAKSSFMYHEITIQIFYDTEEEKYILNTRGNISDGEYSGDIFIKNMNMEYSREGVLKGRGMITDKSEQMVVNAVIKEEKENFFMLITKGSTDQVFPGGTMGKGVAFVKEHKFLKTACFYNVKADEVYYFEFQKKSEPNKKPLKTL
jgi:hypothetical protein